MIDYGIIITGIIGIITTVVSAWVSWFFTRKKYAVEVDNSIIEGMQKSLEFYKTLSNDNKERLEEMIKRNDALEAEISDLKKQVFNLMGSICMDLTCTLRKRDINLFDNIRHGNYSKEEGKDS